MEEKSKSRRLLNFVIIVFVIIGTILVLAEMYQNVSNNLNQKKSIGVHKRDVGRIQIINAKKNVHSEEHSHEESTFKI